MKQIYTCQICEYQADSRHPSCILSHLHDKHGINRGSRDAGPSDGFRKYIDSYIGNPGCACGCGRKVDIHKRRLQFNLFADDCDNSRRFASPSCPEFYLFRGCSAQETIDAISKAQARDISDSRKRKLSRINAGISNPASIESIAARTGYDYDKIRNILSNRSSGVKNGFFGKTHTAETLQRLALLRSMQSKCASRPEMIMYGILIAWGVDFDYQVAIDRYIVDFVVGHNIIEVYGDYWHSTRLHGGRKKKLDTDKIKNLHDMGYEVTVIWESQLINKRIEDIRLVLRSAGVIT